jgi:hypothetical protein
MCKKEIKSKTKNLFLQTLTVYLNVCRLMKEKSIKRNKKMSRKANENIKSNAAMQQNFCFGQTELERFSIDLEFYYDTNESIYDENSDVTSYETFSSAVSSSDSFEDTIDDENEVALEVYSNSNSNLLVTFDDDDEFKEDQLDLSKEKNIVKHILSNLKFGMDLESIPLPAFILESRSVLEMLADLYSYSDLFVQIPDGQTEYERFKRVVKWYLSTFRARLVPKKPYNPIIGEVFQCIYEIGNSDENFERKITPNRPISWANSNDLSFVAEQVSHHPPISAFYLEHSNRGIQLNGFAKSVSKFYGLSVGVESIGNSVISLLKYDEEYVFTYPASFVRSILTVPWLEIVGKVTISCQKSGYSAQINFLPKPFYGGKKHQIEATVFSPDKNIVNKLYGDWTETIYIQTDSSIDTFLESSSLRKHKKKVRKIIDQEENESRKVWQEVTHHLRNKQCDLANKAKIQVEQKQREEAICRKNKNIEWTSKYFHLSDNQWNFNEPLKKRIV